MDFADFDTVTIGQEGRPMTVKTPTGEDMVDDDGKPVTITLLGGDAPSVVAITNAVIDKRTKTGRVSQSNAESMDMLADIASKCTIGWSGIKVKGALLDFSPANAKDFYRKFPWVREQVDIFVSLRKNFFKMPSTI